MLINLSYVLVPVAEVARGTNARASAFSLSGRENSVRERKENEDR